VPEKELNLLQLASVDMAQLCACLTRIVRLEMIKLDSLRRAERLFLGNTWPAPADAEVTTRRLEHSLPLEARSRRASRLACRRPGLQNNGSSGIVVSLRRTLGLMIS
jgi:hypothetical protein